MRKSIKTLLHLWISMVSVAAFGFGWIFLAHAEKPTPQVIPQVEITSFNQPILEPIPSINDLLQNEASNPTIFQNSSNAFPRLRTRGS